MNCNITDILKKIILIEKSTLQVTTRVLCSEQLFIWNSISFLPSSSASYINMEIPLTYYSHFSLNKTIFHCKPDIQSSG